MLNRKNYYKLFTPGPVNIPESILNITKNYHHRTIEFSQILKKTLDSLKILFGTENMILPVHATGRGALEGAFDNILNKDDKLLVITNGKFGDMGYKLSKKIGVNAKSYIKDWEKEVDINELSKELSSKEYDALYVVFSDTSNALVNPIKEIGELCKKYNVLYFVDVVSTVGCMPVDFDENNIDVAVTSSQKGLMSYAGCSFVALSKRAWKRCEEKGSNRSYIDFIAIKKFLNNKIETPGSTPVGNILQVNEALSLIEKEGYDNLYKRHKVLSMATKGAIQSLGLELFPKDCKLRSDSLTVFSVRDGMNTQDIVDFMKDNYNVLIAKGLNEYASRTLRMAHMGNYYLNDMLECICAFEAALYKLGYIDSVGTGIKTFLDITSEYGGAYE